MSLCHLITSFAAAAAGAAGATPGAPFTASSTHHGASNGTAGTAFVYVGSDVDTFPLWYLRPRETAILYVDPLIWLRNSERIEEANEAHKGERQAPPHSALPTHTVHLPSVRC